MHPLHDGKVVDVAFGADDDEALWDELLPPPVLLVARGVAAYNTGAGVGRADVLHSFALRAVHPSGESDSRYEPAALLRVLRRSEELVDADVFAEAPVKNGVHFLRVKGV